jgi:hypothetical protein
LDCSQTRELSKAQLRAGSGRTIAGIVEILVATRLRYTAYCGGRPPWQLGSATGR